MDEMEFVTRLVAATAFSKSNAKKLKRIASLKSRLFLKGLIVNKIFGQRLNGGSMQRFKRLCYELAEAISKPGDDKEKIASSFAYNIFPIMRGLPLSKIEKMKFILSILLCILAYSILWMLKDGIIQFGNQFASTIFVLIITIPISIIASYGIFSKGPFVGLTMRFSTFLAAIYLIGLIISAFYLV